MSRNPASLPLGEQLARLVPELDCLIADAQHRDAAPGRFGQLQYHELKERAVALAEALVAPFQKAPVERAVNPPKFIERRTDGSVRAGW